MRMFSRSGLEGSALARAKAQLSGRRMVESLNVYGDELQDYMTGCKKNSALMVSPFNNEISDLSDLSIEDTVEREWKGKQSAITAATIRPAEGISEHLLTYDQFLKKGDKLAVTQNLKVSNCALKKVDEANTKNLKAAPARAGSSNTVLARLAQIENKIMNRRLNKHQINPDENLQMYDDEDISPKSSTELSGKGSRFLKRTMNTVAKQDLKAEFQNNEASKKDLPHAYLQTPVEVAIIDSDEEEMKKMLGGSLELSDESELLKRSQGSPQHGSKLHKKPVLRNYPRGHLRMPSPPSVGSPQLSLSPRMKFVKRIPTSSTEQSEIKSLDELFTEASITDDVKSLDETIDDFKLNILTLEDLVPFVEQKCMNKSLTLENEESQHSGDQSKQSVSYNSRLNMTNEVISSCSQPTKLSREKNANNLENEIWADFDATGSEISECLNEDSNVSKKGRKSPGNVPDQLEVDDQSTMCSKYSEDFETSNCEVPSVKMDQDESHFQQSSEEESRTDYSDNTFYSTSSPATPDQSNLATCTESSYSVRYMKLKLSKVAVKDTAIQTQPSGFHYTWHRDEGLAVLGTSLGAAYVDPTPIASHVISPEAMEALTAYSPATLALNDLLKQQLSFTRQFLQVNRHLYLTIIASIEQDKYHYTTLEETKEYVRNHRSPPLTLDQALKEVHEEMQQYHVI